MSSDWPTGWHLSWENPARSLAMSLSHIRQLDLTKTQIADRKPARFLSLNLGLLAKFDLVVRERRLKLTFDKSIHSHVSGPNIATGCHLQNWQTLRWRWRIGGMRKKEGKPANQQGGLSGSAREKKSWSRYFSLSNSKINHSFSEAKSCLNTLGKKVH